ncbi:succinate dehydrogenase, cytochrome b556 subunit [Facilibium subflavum]|uniref:succinate dehydrogenase, cytochrome b556 subunit n=1 Tax=Facilibium subflavum TaxID=2219058 RepID=UPI000E64BB18|nr:succinate dehydrogenase, cytochrome b556 subunit [Facilibium subflavum]
MKHEGPRNISLGSIAGYKFPITAISSILHRVTGLLMVVLLPFLLWGFDLSVRGGDSFYYVQYLLLHTPWSFVAWLFLSAISYHVFAGIRHLIMDLGMGEEMTVARITSSFVLILGVLAAIFWGVWLWLM